MRTPPFCQPFVADPEGPLAAEHEAVQRWVDEAVASLGEHGWYREIELKSLDSGQRLLDASPPQACQYVRAALAQVQYWDQLAGQVRDQAESGIARVNAHHLPGWEYVWSRRRQTEAVVRHLLRRALPLERDDIVRLLTWCNAMEQVWSGGAPLGAITRAVERYTSQSAMDADLRQELSKFAVRLQACQDKEARRWAAKIQPLLGEARLPDEANAAGPRLPAPGPALAGNANVLTELKRWLGLLSEEASPAVAPVGPDQFPLPVESPLEEEHMVLTAFFEEAANSRDHYAPDLKRHRVGQKILALGPAEAARLLLAAAERHAYSLLGPDVDYTQPAVWQARTTAAGLIKPLSGFQLLQFTRDEAFDVLFYLGAQPAHLHDDTHDLLRRLLPFVEEQAAIEPLSQGERYVLWLLRASLTGAPPLGTLPELPARLTRLIGDGASFCLVPGEVWTDGLNEDFAAMDSARRAAWTALLGHALTASAARPSAKWLKTAAKLLKDVGPEAMHKALERWLPLVAKGRSLGKLSAYAGDARTTADTMNEENAICLRGILWMIQLLPSAAELCRQVTAVALSAYKKVPGVGPRAVKVGNAAVYALAEMPSTDAVGQLAMLKVRVKFGTAQKEIEKAYATAAEKIGLGREEMEEMGVPSYGLEAGGKRRERLGQYEAELVASGTNARLAWYDASGKALKSIPAKVKKEHAEEVKDLQQSLKDIQAMLPAQRDRLDSLFLSQKTWPIEVWRARYLDHPLVGTIASRLLWCVDGTPALFIDGAAVDEQGRAIPHGKTAEISLWHPVGRSIEEITAWRRRLEELAIVQPFKQAHREVYLLTDAERRTNTYSNRFAAHIIRQHQFNALCAARGWKNKLRLLVDDSYPPPTKHLPGWGLRAEFWVESIGDDFGQDTNDSGVFLRLATDQVRFYRPDAAANYAHAGGGAYSTHAAGPGADNINDPLPLEQIPPLVLSEVLRDVDLFVGVASVGNDPTWQDGGPEGRYRDYWQRYSFGDLSGTATTRKQVLERLVPRLKIASQCSFSDRFLVVRGSKRTYKIHLGSGNILMEPNDQYLCIVPDSRARAKQDDVLLPFEGDATLSIIISKALLLADDHKIQDPTITRQIG